MAAFPLACGAACGFTRRVRLPHAGAFAEAIGAPSAVSAWLLARFATTAPTDAGVVVHRTELLQDKLALHVVVVALPGASAEQERESQKGGEDQS